MQGNGGKYGLWITAFSLRNKAGTYSFKEAVI